MCLRIQLMVCCLVQNVVTSQIYSPKAWLECLLLFIICNCTYLVKLNSTSLSWHCRDWWSRRLLCMIANAVDVGAVKKK